MVRVGRSISGGLNLVGWSKAIPLNEDRRASINGRASHSLEFNVPGAQGIYDKVNAALGFDPDSTASYPKGLLSHIVGLGADGASIAVTEVWNSEEGPGGFPGRQARSGPGRGRSPRAER